MNEHKIIKPFYSKNIFFGQINSDVSRLYRIILKYSISIYSVAYIANFIEN